jgi:inosose dehydratase
MKVAIPEHALRVPVSQVFAAAHELGFEGVELSIGAFAPQEHLLFQPEGPAQLRQLATESGKTIASISAGFLYQHRGLRSSSLVAELLDRLVEAAAAASAGAVHLPFLGASEIRGSQDRDHAVALLRRLVEKAASQGVACLVETLLPAEDWRGFLNQCGTSGCLAAYDVGNARAVGRDVRAEIQLLGDRLGQVRIKDRERREPFASVPLGQGHVDVRGILQSLKQMAYQHWLVLDTPGGAEPYQSARANLEYLRGLA